LSPSCHRQDSQSIESNQLIALPGITL
jgi:hypothetical protein